MAGGIDATGSTSRPADINDLYVTQELPADEVGGQLGVSLKSCCGRPTAMGSPCVLEARHRSQPQTFG